MAHLVNLGDRAGADPSGYATGDGWGIIVAGWQDRRLENYAVGLEIWCAGGAYNWAPEIPSDVAIARAIPGQM
jgi:hypothetical protein